jgi:dihydroflavonol-4-reductase
MSEKKYKKALITGVCGFCGSYMAELLLENGYNVRGTCRATSDKKYIKNLDMEFISADLTKPEDWPKVLKGVDIIFNTAAIFDYLPSMETMRKVNVEGMKNLLEAAQKTGVKRFIHWSTIDIYGDPLPEFTPITESHPINPKNPYQITKWEQEKLVVDFCEKNKIDYTIIRPCPIYGPRSEYGIVSIPIVIGRGYVLFYPSGDKLHLPLVHVKDVCRAALFLAERGDSVGEVYQVCDDTWYTHERVFGYIADIFGIRREMIGLPLPIWLIKPMLKKFAVYWRKKTAKAYPTRLPFDADELDYGYNDYRFSNAKLKNLGFKFDYPDFAVGMPETIDWLKKNNLV